mmetsp:Transcript_17293/g.37583  ORF Transcript_17293/g.37583 Transcript_17293/m.37583 type:complete len:342 (+) Transcript_17293:1761-2786(+)
MGSCHGRHQFVPHGHVAVSALVLVRFVSFDGRAIHVRPKFDARVRVHGRAPGSRWVVGASDAGVLRPDRVDGHQILTVFSDGHMRHSRRRDVGIGRIPAAHAVVGCHLERTHDRRRPRIVPMHHPRRPRQIRQHRQLRNRILHDDHRTPTTPVLLFLPIVLLLIVRQRHSRQSPFLPNACVIRPVDTLHRIVRTEHVHLVRMRTIRDVDDGTVGNARDEVGRTVEVAIQLPRDQHRFLPSGEQTGRVGEAAVPVSVPAGGGRDERERADRVGVPMHRLTHGRLLGMLFPFLWRSTIEVVCRVLEHVVQYLDASVGPAHREVSRVGGYRHGGEGAVVSVGLG